MGLSIFSQKIFHRLQFSPQVQSVIDGQNGDNQSSDQVEIEFKDYRQEDKVVFNIEPMGIHERGIFFTLKLAD